MYSMTASRRFMRSASRAHHIETVARIIHERRVETSFNPKCVHHSCDVSSNGTERRCAMPEAEGSSPSRRTTCSLSSSGWTRTPPSHGEDWGSNPHESANVRSRRLARPRTPPFQGENTSSNLVGNTNYARIWRIRIDWEVVYPAGQRTLAPRMWVRALPSQPT